MWKELIFICWLTPLQIANAELQRYGVDESEARVTLAIIDSHMGWATDRYAACRGDPFAEQLYWEFVNRRIAWYNLLEALQYKHSPLWCPYHVGQLRKALGDNNLGRMPDPLPLHLYLDITDTPYAPRTPHQKKLPPPPPDTRPSS